MRQKSRALSISFWVANSPTRSRSATPCFLAAQFSLVTNSSISTMSAKGESLRPSKATSLAPAPAGKIYEYTP